MIISVDFDGTICDHAYPEVGELMEGAVETLKDFIAAGHVVILNTCREDEKRRPYLTEAVNFMKKNGVEFASVNTNRPEDEFRDKPGRKVFAELYIDDRNLGGLGTVELKSGEIYGYLKKNLAKSMILASEIQC